MPIDPTMAVSGAEWQMPAIDSPVPQGDDKGFGAMLGQSVQSLQATQTDATSAAQALASGQATDPTAVVVAVERAQLAMQLAAQVRTKAVDAAQEIFHTQV